MKKVLITGAKGRIGKILINVMSTDYEIFELDHKPDSKNPKYFQVDISNKTRLFSAFKKMGKLDAIVHLAAKSDPETSWGSILKNNIIGTRNIYQAAIKFRASKVIFASSIQVAAGYEGLPKTLHKKKSPKVIKVDDPTKPTNYYGISKVFGEELAKMFYELHNLPSICLRIGTVVENDIPTYERTLKTWLSHRDLVQIIRKSIETKKKFGIYFAISKNKGRYFDISKTARELKYNPQDDASKARKD